jgi:hypothetical protein
MGIFLTMTSWPPTAATTSRVLRPAAVHHGPYGLRDEHGIHDLALDNGIRHERARDDLHDLGLGLRVIDDDQLDQAAPDIEADRKLVPTEESH